MAGAGAMASPPPALFPALPYYVTRTDLESKIYILEARSEPNDRHQHY